MRSVKLSRCAKRDVLGCGFAGLECDRRQRRHDQRLADGTWAPKTNTIRYAARFMKLITVHGEAVRTYSDFHKFQADSTIQFTDKIEEWH